MIIRLDSCPRKRYTISKLSIDQRQVVHCQWVLFVFSFTLAVDFGKLRCTCQVIPNSKFFQVIFKQPRTEENV